MGYFTPPASCCQCLDYRAARPWNYHPGSITNQCHPSLASDYQKVAFIRSKFVSDQIAKLVTALLEAWNTHDIDHISTFYAPEYVGIDVADAQPQSGIGGIRHMLQRYFHAFPDMHFSLDATVTEDERVALFWTAHGTHQGKLMNIPPTGREIRVRGVSYLTVKQGKICHAEYIWDVAGLLRAIGLLPRL
ncbi:MAG: ester cyclase [Chloroflexi bacterium]|nr:ester cyclase [Chloroflexota bacterium]